MQEKHIMFSISKTNTIYVCSLLYHTTMTAIFSAAFRIDMAVGIIEMQDCKILSSN
jgi:hypothetical protein